MNQDGLFCLEFRFELDRRALREIDPAKRKQDGLYVPLTTTQACGNFAELPNLLIDIYLGCSTAGGLANFDAGI